MAACQKSILHFISITLTSVSLFMSSATAEVPTQLEPEYAEAVLAFNGKQYGRALKILDELIKLSPRSVEFLEMKALALKVTQDIKKVTYRVDLKRVIRRKLVLGIADGQMEADGEVIYRAKDLRVGLFTTQGEG